VEARAEGRRGQQPAVELDHEVLQLVRQLRRRLVMEGSTLQLEIGHIEPVRVRGEEESLRRIALSCWITRSNIPSVAVRTAGGA
jgi:hypothetical protein